MTAKVLILDIETAPKLAHVWGLFQQNVGLNQLVADMYIMAVAGKWLGADNCGYAEARTEADEAALAAKVWKWVDEADILVGHNMRRFDLPHLYAAFARAGLPPPSPVKVVDTLEICKRHFKFTSNRLEFIAKALKVPEKSGHKEFPGHLLWSECLKGNKAAWAEMKAYNVQDVLTTEHVYLKVRPYAAGHPAVNVENPGEEHTCPTCGSASVQRRGYATTKVGKYSRYQCGSCGAWSRTRTTEHTKTERRAVLTSI